MILSANILYLVGFIISSSALRWAMHSWRPAFLVLTRLDQIKCRVIARIQISTSLSGTSKFKISVSFIDPNFLLIVRSQLPTWYVNPHLKKQCSKFATTLHPNRHEAGRLPMVELMRSSEREWTLSAEMFNQGHGSVLQYSPVWLYMHTCHGWLPLQLVSWGKAQSLYYTKHCNELYNT